MSNRFIDPIPQFLDNVGQPYASGSVQFCLTATDTPTDTYNSSALSVANPNPVLLNQAGRFSSDGSNEIDVYLDPNVVYRVKFYDADGVLFRTVENVKDHAANVTAALQVFNGDPNGNVAGNQGTVGGAGASVVWDYTGSILWICTTTGTDVTAVWSAYGSELNSVVKYSGVVTPTSISADANDYDPTGFATSSHLRQDSTVDIAITGFGSPSTGRFFVYHNTSNFKHTLMSESTGSTAVNRMIMDADLTVYPDQTVQFWYDAALLRWKVQGAFFNAPTGDPGGRLTLSSNSPILTSDVTAATTLYYTPYRHNYIRLYNGTHWYVVQFSELSQTLADATNSPSAAAASSIYDLFVWNNAGTLCLSRGPAWTVGGGSATARGTGAGSTELERVDGVLMNKIAVSNGPAAQRGVYVGTISTSATGVNGQLNMMFAPAAAAGGTGNRLDVWNTYNRVWFSAVCRDNTDSWASVTGAGAWRNANASASNRVTVVVGRNEDHLHCVGSMNGGSVSTNGKIHAGIGVDSSTVASGFAVQNNNSGSGTVSWVPMKPEFVGSVGIGSHFFQLLENAAGVVAGTWLGDDGAALVQSGLYVRALM